MKKIISIVLSLAMACSIMAVPAFAASAEQGATAPVVGVSPRAVKPPTMEAPHSWYDAYHTFTCAQYTYSSYIFSATMTDYVGFTSPKKFHVVPYTADGTKLDPVEATKTGNKYTAELRCPED